MAMVLAAGPVAEERDCLDLPKAEQPFCWMMLSCAVIEDAERRQECFDSVIARYERERAPSDPESVAETPPAEQESEQPEPLVQPAPVEEPAPVVRPPPEEQRTPDVLTESATPASRAEVSRAAAAPTQAESVTRDGERPWWQRVLRRPWPRRDEPVTRPEPEPAVAISNVGVEMVQREVLNIPKRFTAEVTDVHALLHDRQLLVLDAKLLFETERASHSRIKSGEVIKVTRTSELFGERYSVVGESGGAVRASRLRCESDDRGPETVRKCALLARATRSDGD